MPMSEGATPLPQQHSTGTACVEAPPLTALKPHEVQRLLATGPMGALLKLLDEHPGAGWIIKESKSLRYRAWGGALPQVQATICHARSLQAGQTDADHFAKAQAVLLRLADLKAVTQGRPSTDEHRIEPWVDDPAQAPWEWRVWRWSVPPASEGEPGYLCVVWLDRMVTDRLQQQVDQLQQQLQAQQLLIAELRGHTGRAASSPADASDTDDPALTWSAAHFERQVRRELDLSRREHRAFSVLMIDLAVDRLEGAARLAAVGLMARHLATGTRAMDTVAQVGEARFGVILSGAALAPAYARAEALRRGIQELVVLVGDAPTPLSIAIGAAAFPHHAEQSEALMERALDALREAEALGGSQTVTARIHLRAPESN